MFILCLGRYKFQLLPTEIALLFSCASVSVWVCVDFFISISILYRCCLHRSHENSQLKPWILHTQRHAIHHFIWINFIAPHSWHVIWLFICNAHHMKNLCADRTQMLRHLIESKFCAPTTLVNTHNRHMSIYHVQVQRALCTTIQSNTHV